MGADTDASPTGQGTGDSMAMCTAGRSTEPVVVAASPLGGRSTAVPGTVSAAPAIADLTTRFASSQRSRYAAGSAPHALTNSTVVPQLGSLCPFAASCNVVCEIAPDLPDISRKGGLPTDLRSSRRIDAKSAITAVCARMSSTG